MFECTKHAITWIAFNDEMYNAGEVQVLLELSWYWSNKNRVFYE